MAQTQQEEQLNGQYPQYQQTQGSSWEVDLGQPCSAQAAAAAVGLAWSCQGQGDLCLCHGPCPLPLL